jgi:hypothetical protein
MELLSLLKRNRELEFESLLARAAVDPVCEPVLIRNLLSTKLLLITFDHFKTDGYHLVEKDTPVDIYTYSNGEVPVFSSTERIFDNNVHSEKVKYIAMEGQMLFTILKNKNLVLNPNSEYSMEFNPNDIKLLLSGQKAGKLIKHRNLATVR